MPAVTVVDRASTAHVALSPLRRSILNTLEDAASATEVAARLGLPRQKVNYHMSVLERHGLIELAETRQRRGFTERRFRRHGTVVLAPDLLEPVDAPADDLSSEAVIAAATDVIRSVGALEAQGEPHPTATLSADVTFMSPADMHRFLEGVATLAAQHDRGEGGDGARFKITLMAHLTQGEHQ